MKVYQLRLIMGKATNYDQEGKLKNHVMTVKYAGELELENILEDQNWRKLGACEISCVGVFDTETKGSDTELMKAINDRIKSEIQAGIKPKTEIELLKEQIASLTAKVNKPVITVTSNDGQRTVVVNDNPTEKELREFLFTEAKELNLNPAKNVKTDILRDLIANAKKVKA